LLANQLDELLAQQCLGADDGPRVLSKPDARLERHSHQRVALAGIANHGHTADVNPTDPNLGLGYEPVGAGKFRVERELIAPGPAQPHVERDQAQPAKADRAEEEHHKDADDGAAGHQGAPAWKHWSAQCTRHM
jgi:hypothetical protein